MNRAFEKNQRLYASIVILGISILIYRTIILPVEGSLYVLKPWVNVILFVEMSIDFLCLITAVRWWRYNSLNFSWIPLQLGAGAAMFHALRVVVFILGRTGPWVNFDVNPAYRSTHAERWTWEGVYFAAILSFLGIIGAVYVLRFVKRNKKPGEV